jgi:glycosyltransferase involved in cell wall biosynthesis
MRRFAALLHQGLTAKGVDVEVVEPTAIVGRSTTGHAGIDKWLRYVDKFVLFPPRLRGVVRRNGRARLVVHVCDHSNAVYVPARPNVLHVVTCHDLLAVRSALGEFSQARTAWMGRRLQRAISNGLRRAGHVICDSTATLTDVQRILGLPLGTTSVIHPAVSPVFVHAGRIDRRARVRRLLGASAPARYVLHVGGNQWYKNRAGVIEIYAALVARDPDAPALVMAGKPLTPELRLLLTRYGLANRVIAVSDTSDEDLAALYSSATVLLFPSLAEGFGWPVLEAMACGCRVVTAHRAPMTELGADAATYINPDQPATAAATLAEVLVEPDTVRRDRIEAGLRRAGSFTPERMADAYMRVYRRVLSARRAAWCQAAAAHP